MSFFFITVVGDTDNPYLGDQFQLDAVTSATRTLQADVTEFPTENGYSISDNFIAKGQEIKFEGIISDFKAGSNTGSLSLPAGTVLTALQYLRDNGSLLHVASGDLNNTVGNIVKSCVITNLSFKQDSQNGIARGRLASYRVSITFKEIRLREQATLTNLTRIVKPEVSDVAQYENQKDVVKVTKLNRRGRIKKKGNPIGTSTTTTTN